MPLDQGVTLLLGKNENGKTNVLLAFEAFDVEFSYGSEDICRYSPVRSQLENGEISPSEVPMMALWLALESSERKVLARAAQGLGRNTKEVKVTKFFDDHYVFEIDGKVIAEPVEERQGTRQDFLTLHDDIRATLSVFTQSMTAHAARWAPFAEALPTLASATDSLLSTLEDSSNDEAAVDAGLVAFSALLSSLPNMDQPIIDEVAAIKENLGQYRALLEDLTTQPEVIPPKLTELLPRFIYFNDVDRLEDKVAVADFLADPQKSQTLANLVKLTKLDVHKLKEQDEFRRREATELASTQITGLVNDAWTQERIRVDISVDGDQLILIVKDDKGGYDPPSKRSTGFQWYLGFYINFNAGSGGDLSNTILLLDDPGVYLHPSGQKDLLKTIERLAKDNQFIVATHSPFLIDRAKLERIRIVEKRAESKGSRIRTKWHESDHDAFEPIRAALGLTLGDSLFSNRKNIVVEGLSDFFVLSGFAALCTRLDKSSIDLDEVALLPVGGAPKVPYWATILLKEKLNAVALLDHDDEGRKARTQLVNELGAPPKAVITLENFRADGACQDVSIEDLVDPALYYKAFELAYKTIFSLKGKAIPKLAALKAAKCSRTKPYIDFFKANDLGQFDKVAVSRMIQQICVDLNLDNADFDPECASRFSTLFETLSAALTTGS